MLPLLEESKSKWEDRQLFFHKGRWEKEADPNQNKLKACAVRTQRWRFVNNEELFDIKKDPFETTNVAAEHPDIVNFLREKYDDWWSETVPMMVNEDAPYSVSHPQGVRYEKQLKSIGIPNWEPTMTMRK